MKNEVALLVEENLKCRILGFEKSAGEQAQNQFRIFEIQKQAVVERTCENKLEIEFLEFI